MILKMPNGSEIVLDRAAIQVEINHKYKLISAMNEIKTLLASEASDTDKVNTIDELINKPDISLIIRIRT